MYVSDDTTAQYLAEGMTRWLDGVQHSSPSVKKYREFERFIASHLRLDPSQVYAAFISKPGNITVRFDQSKRARNAQILVALIDPDSIEHPMQSVETLMRYCSTQRPDVEGLVVAWQEGWQPYAVIVPAQVLQRRLQPIIDLRRVRVELYNPNAQLSLLDTQAPSRILTDEDLGPSTEVRFLVVDPEQPVDLDADEQFPFAVLTRDPWDDSGLKAMFSLTVHLGPERQPRQVPIGDVKILKKGQVSGRTAIVGDSFTELTSDYYSLGQSYSYYENIRQLPIDVHNAVLKGLRDVAFDRGIREAVQNEPAFDESLKRTGQAARALEDASKYFGTAHGGLEFTFTTNVGGQSFSTEFSFNHSTYLPDRVNAVIGYNGCGKTQLLAHIALVATSDLTQRERYSKYGTIEGADDVRFSSVIAISYSAFDTFVLPDGFWKSNEAELARRRLEEKGDVFGYAYCGLRKREEGDDEPLQSLATDPNYERPAPRGLKSIDDITDEFAKALNRARSPLRRVSLHAAIEIIQAEPSFALMGLEPYEAVNTDEWREHFEKLSTGHKIVLNILMQIIGHSDPGSLILIDEPESHLHPSLLAALMRAVNVVLRELGSYAIVATHSPVVLQEIPRRYVRILQRFGESTNVLKPLTETFGENVGYLTTNVFDLDSRKTDYHEVLAKLAEEKTLDEIEALFDGAMSMQARAYLLSLKRQGRK